MASRARDTTTADLGIVDGWFGEDRGGAHLAETRVDVRVSGPERMDDAQFAVLTLGVRLPGTYDKSVELELPLHTARQLRDALDDVIRAAEDR